MDETQAHINLFRNTVHRAIAYVPAYRKLTGSLTGAILLSQIAYWTSLKPKFYKTDKKMMKETGLTFKELRNAKIKLRNIPFLKITREGSPAITYYEIDHEKWTEVMSNLPPDITNPDWPKGTIQIGRKGQTRLAERDKLDWPKGTNSLSQITSKITSIPQQVAGSENSNEKEREKKPLHPRWAKYAAQLASSISKSRNINKLSKPATWGVPIEKLHRIDGISVPRIKSVLDWYCDQWTNQDLIQDNSSFIPIAYNGANFREKFLRIEAAKIRLSKTECESTGGMRIKVIRDQGNEAY